MIKWIKMEKGQEVWTGSEAQMREYAKNNPTKSVPAKARAKAQAKAPAKPQAKARPKK